MSDMTIKTILAAAFLAAGTAAFLTMMTVMGRPGVAGDPAKLRRLHKVFGWLYVALLAPLVYLGLGFIREMGDGMSTRGVFHFVLAEALIALLLLKLLVVRVFRGPAQERDGPGDDALRVDPCRLPHHGRFLRPADVRRGLATGAVPAGDCPSYILLLRGSLAPISTSQASSLRPRRSTSSGRSAARSSVSPSSSAML